MNTKRFPLTWMNVWADESANPSFIPAGPWIPTANAQYCRVMWEIHNIQSPLEVAPAWQVANTEDSPGGVDQVVTPKTSVDVYYPDDWKNMLTATQSTKDNVLFRWGWWVKRTSGTGLVMATVAGVAEYQIR